MADTPKKKEPIKASTKDVNIGKEIGSFMLNDYIIPKSKDVIYNFISSVFDMGIDALQGGLRKVFYGEDRRPTNSSNGSYYTRQQTNYQSFSRPANQSRSVAKRDIGNRSSTEVKYIWVDTEQDAINLIADLKEICDNYDGKVKVADLYESLTPKVPTTFQDFKYGWTDVSQFSYHKEYTGEHRGQWMLDLPRPIDITNV